MVNVVVDRRGRVVHFEVLPPQRVPPASEVSAAGWSALFSAAGLDSTLFHLAAPEWAPLAWGDARAAWTGFFPGHEDIPVRIEAASYRGRPIYFDLIYPWTKPARSTPHPPALGQEICVVSLGLHLFALL